MTKFNDRRKHKRFSVIIPLNVNGEKFLQFRKSSNLSLGGIFIATNLLEKVGTEIKVDFLFEEDWEKIKVVGMVRWLSEDKNHPGMGIEFVDPPANFIRKIEKYLE